MAGATIQNMTTNATKTLTSAHHGDTSGDIMYEIWLQSNVKMPMPRPDETPKSWLTTTLPASGTRERGQLADPGRVERRRDALGKIQQTQENAERPTKMKPEEERGRAVS